MNPMQARNIGTGGKDFGGKPKLVIGWVCSAPMYQFKGWLFECHYYLGPWPLKKDLEPRKRDGKKFYDLLEEFNNLTESQKKQYRIGGGYQAVG